MQKLNFNSPMTFVSTLTDDEDYVHVHRDGNSYRVATQIGYDDEKETIFYLVVMLDVVPAWDYELRYWIEEYDNETEEFFMYWDRADVRKFIGSEDRKKIIDSLLSLVRHLVRLVRPCSVTISLKDSGNGPHRKDMMLLEVFADCGYEVTLCDPWYGQRVCRLERREDCES